MGNDQQRIFAVPEFFDPARDDFDRVHVQAGIRLVQNGELRVQHQHLQNLGFFLFPAGKADVQVPGGVLLIHAQLGHLLPELPLVGEQAHGLARERHPRSAQEIFQRDAGHFLRALEREEQPRLRALVRGQAGDVLPPEQDGTLLHFVLGMPHNGIYKRGFARAVRPHQNVDLPFVYGKVHSLQDFGAVHADLQIFYFQQHHIHLCKGRLPQRPVL